MKSILKSEKTSFKDWYGSGEPFIWLNAAAVSLSIIAVVGLIYILMVNGFGHFWPKDVLQAQYQLPEKTVQQLIGERVNTEDVSRKQLKDSGLVLPEARDTYQRSLIKRGNRDIKAEDFVWVIDAYLTDVKYPEQLMVLERREWGNFYGFLESFKLGDKEAVTGEAAVIALQESIKRAKGIYSEIKAIEKGEIQNINHDLERLRLKERRLELKDKLTVAAQNELAEARAEQAALYKVQQSKLEIFYQQLSQDKIIMRDKDGLEKEIAVSMIVDAYQPNQMSLFEKVGFYFHKLFLFLTDEPREANTEGGVFPAIFGTVLMVILMSIIVTPFGVIAAIYLREYAKQGLITRSIRIAVNNLAGVPSIVYGVFGLGFFVYFIGAEIDQVFYEAALPAPTFGTPGLLWASITLALLTLPVVIVSTEEGLARIPRALREGSLAMGATKAETLWRVVLPMSSPAMMTGLILAVARAAGEVAPLMLVGVVKLAPTLPLNDQYPYLHLDQKFMHLGFHIYDVGFQSPNVEAARPLVFATALLLVIIIALLNFSAVALRNRLRERYKGLEN